MCGGRQVTWLLGLYVGMHVAWLVVFVCWQNMVWLLRNVCQQACGLTTFEVCLLALGSFAGDNSGITLNGGNVAHSSCQAGEVNPGR